MIKNESTLRQIIQTIANQPEGFGNRLLYDMCLNKPGQTWDDVAVLADKIWLIGRSYAASPERRSKTKSETGLQGDATGKFFTKMAQYIARQRDEGLVKHCSALNTDAFRFDGSQKDADLLNAGIGAVAALNALVKDAAAACDGAQADKDNYRNQISFCSKFLHFHFPNAVFIIDSYSQESARVLFSNNSRSDRELRYDGKTVTIKNAGLAPAEKGAAHLLNGDFSEWERQVADCSGQEVADYAKHCVYAYKTACLIKQLLGNTPPNSSLPRCADTLLIHIKKAKTKG